MDFLWMMNVVFLVIIAGICFYNIFTLVYKNIILLPVFVLAIVVRIYKYQLSGDILVILDGVGGMAVILILLRMFLYKSKGGFGGGDIKLLAVIGFYLGLIYSVLFIIVAKVIIMIYGHYIKGLMERQLRSRYATGVIWLYTYAITMLVSFSVLLINGFDLYHVVLFDFFVTWVYVFYTGIKRSIKDRKT